MARKNKARRYSHTCTRCGKLWKAYRRVPLKCRWCGSTYWHRPYEKPAMSLDSLRLDSLRFSKAGGEKSDT